MVSDDRTNDVQVATFGEAMILIDPVATGSLTLSSTAQVRFAAAESNFAIGLSRLGPTLRELQAPRQ